MTAQAALPVYTPDGWRALRAASCDPVGNYDAWNRTMRAAQFANPESIILLEWDEDSIEGCVEWCRLVDIPFNSEARVAYASALLAKLNEPVGRA
jgi:hypothetical protein